MRPKSVWIVWLVGGAQSALAQCSPDWLVVQGQGIPGVGGIARATTSWDPDGAGPMPERLVIAGSFAQAGNVLASNVATFDGASWDNLGGGVTGGAGPTVYALTALRNELIAGGTFTSAGGLGNFGIAAWNGTAWRSLGGNPNQEPRAMIVFDDRLIVGGGLLTGGNPSGTLVARWDGVAWEEITWGIDLTSVRAFAEHQGELFAGGWVYYGPNTTISRLVDDKWQSIGEQLAGPVHALVSHGGGLYAGGEFYTSAVGASAPFIARWNGQHWIAVGDGLAFPNYGPAGVWSLASYGGDLFAGGRFKQSGSTPMSTLARWNGTKWSSVGLGSSESSDGHALSLFANQLIAAGNFTRAGSVNALHVASWNDQQWRGVGTSPTGPAAGPDGPVTSISKFNDDLYFGGSFTSVGGLPSSGVARRHEQQWHPVGTGVNGVVNALAPFDGGIVAAGVYSEASGTPANNIARWDGASWHAMGLGIEGVSNFGVLALQRLADDCLLVGGQFTQAGGLPASNFAIWDGESWLDGVPGFNGRVTDMIKVGSDAVVAGIFSIAGTTSTNLAARWDGSAWHAMPGLPPVGSWCFPYHARVGEHHGTLYFALGTICPNTGAKNAIYQWDGSAWSLNASMNTIGSSWIFDMASFGDDLLVGGSFKFAGGKPASGIALWDGSTWSPLGTGVAAGTSVGGVATLLVDGQTVHVGGGFWSSGGKPSAYWSRWTCSCPPDCDASGGLDIDDFICFQTLYAVGDPGADCDGSGALNVDDFACFQTAYALGC